MKLYLTPEKQELFIKTAVWNSIVDVFKNEKNIDVSDFLVSIKILNKKIIIKSNKIIFNAEAILLQEKISEKIIKKLKLQEIDFDFELKYL